MFKFVLNLLFKRGNNWWYFIRGSRSSYCNDKTRVSLTKRVKFIRLPKSLPYAGPLLKLQYLYTGVWE